MLGSFVNRFVDKLLRVVVTVLLGGYVGHLSVITVGLKQNMCAGYKRE